MNRPVHDRHEAAAGDRPRERGGVLRLTLSLLLLVLIVVIVGALFMRKTSSSDSKKDVAVTTCHAKDGGRPIASGTIVNHSSKRSDYVIQLEFTDPQGNTVSEGLAPVNGVDSAKRATWKLTGVRSVNGPVQCVVTRVSRSAVFSE